MRKASRDIFGYLLGMMPIAATRVDFSCPLPTFD